MSQGVYIASCRVIIFRVSCILSMKNNVKLLDIELQDLRFKHLPCAMNVPITTRKDRTCVETRIKVFGRTFNVPVKHFNTVVSNIHSLLTACEL